eukprot:8585266-Lingulodinium_polyedra.AAC.1
MREGPLYNPRYSPLCSQPALEHAVQVWSLQYRQSKQSIQTRGSLYNHPTQEPVAQSGHCRAQ